MKCDAVPIPDPRESWQTTSTGAETAETGKGAKDCCSECPIPRNRAGGMRHDSRLELERKEIDREDEEGELERLEEDSDLDEIDQEIIAKYSEMRRNQYTEEALSRVKNVSASEYLETIENADPGTYVLVMLYEEVRVEVIAR